MSAERNGNARLALAARFVAAMLANPNANVYEQSGWKVHACRDGLDVADTLIAMHAADLAAEAADVPLSAAGITTLRTARAAA